MTKPNDKPKHQPPLKNPSDLLNASPPRLPLNTPQPVGSLDKVADRSFAIPVFQSRSKSETRPGCAVPRMARRARSKSTCKGISIMPSTDTPTPCFSPAPQGSLAAALNQRAKEGDISLARRRWQEGTVYVRKSKKLPDAWWGRYVETVETEAGTRRIQRNVRLGDARQFTKPLAKRALREYVDKANCYQPQAAKIQQMGKAAVPFAVFAARWQEEVLIHKKASTTATVQGHIKNMLIPAFGKLAVGDIDSERVQTFLNRLVGKPLSAKTISNVWTTVSMIGVRQWLGNM